MGVHLTGRGFRSRYVLSIFQNQEIILFCPETFMNQSGKSVKACADFYDLDLRKILVIHDDLDLPVGRIKVARNGSAGGHKGVSSIMEYLGSMQFPRIKIGIGRPRYGETLENYVLDPFYPDEMDIMERVFHAGVRACELFVSEGIEPAMNHINCKDLTDKEEKI